MWWHNTTNQRMWWTLYFQSYTNYSYEYTFYFTSNEFHVFERHKVYSFIVFGNSTCICLFICYKRILDYGQFMIFCQSNIKPELGTKALRYSHAVSIYTNIINLKKDLYHEKVKICHLKSRINRPIHY